MPAALHPAERTGQRKGRQAPPNLLDQLRGDASRRPMVDPGLAGGLREWLEDGLSIPASCLPGNGRPIVLTPRRLTAGLDGAPVEPGTWSVRSARDALVRILFRQQVTIGGYEEPAVDAVAAASAEGRMALVSFVDSLSVRARAVLDHEVARRAALIHERWPMPSGTWLPRTAERISLPFAGGRVVLSGEADLMLGAPCTRQASVCLVQVRGGPLGEAARLGRRYLALLETIRSGAPPCRAASYHSAHGRLEAEDVPDALLAEMVDHVIASARALIAARADWFSVP
jgi:hypothetical protein